MAKFTLSEKAELECIERLLPHGSNRYGWGKKNLLEALKLDPYCKDYTYANFIHFHGKLAIEDNLKKYKYNFPKILYLSKVRLDIINVRNWYINFSKSNNIDLENSQIGNFLPSLDFAINNIDNKIEEIRYNVMGSVVKNCPITLIANELGLSLSHMYRLVRLGKIKKSDYDSYNVLSINKSDVIEYIINKYKENI